MNNLQQGINAYKSGNRDEARKYLIAAIKENPNDEHAWGWMYQAANNDKERFECLNRILKINPQNARAKQLLEQLVTPPLRPAQTQGISEPRKSNSSNYALKLIGFTILALFVVCCAIFGIASFVNSSQTASPSSPNQDIPIPISGSMIEYRVSGSSSSATVMIENATNGTEQHDVNLPWSYPRFKASPGQFLSLVATTMNSGTITCEIYANGTLLKRSTSSGQFVTVSCSGFSP